MKKQIEIPVVTAIVVTYCSKNTISNALDALMPCYESGILEAIVVDNSSNDGTLELVKTKYSWVKLIDSKKNLGFAKGCNLGFKQVKTPYTLFLNPDAIITKKSLQVLIDFMKFHPRAGMCAPSIIEENGELQVAGALLTPFGLIKESLGLCGYPKIKKIIPGQQAFSTNWLCGAILLVKSCVFQEVNMFDARYFLYFEETDLCRKITNKKYELWAVGNASAFHKNGTSAKQIRSEMANDCIAEHFYKSRFYYLTKHHGLCRAIISEILSIILIGLHSYAMWISGKSDKGKFISRMNAPILRQPKKEK